MPATKPLVSGFFRESYVLVDTLNNENKYEISKEISYDIVARESYEQVAHAISLARCHKRIQQHSISVISL